MLRKLFLAGCVVVVASLSTTLHAQRNSATSQEAMPELKEAAPEAGQSGLMSGEKPFTLMVDENAGELVYDFDPDTKELRSIIAKIGVIFASEDMTLNADEMEYQALNSQLVASGKRVVVRMGEMIITCQLFNYNPETQNGRFEGKPILYQKDKEGKVTTTAGRIIEVINKDGKLQMKVIGGQGTPTYMKSGGNAAPGNTPLEKKTLAPGEKGATMTLNTQSSNLAVGATTGNSGRSIVPMPGANTNAENEKTTTKSTRNTDSRIDPDNTEDVKKLSGDKAP